MLFSQFEMEFREILNFNITLQNISCNIFEECINARIVIYSTILQSLMIFSDFSNPELIINKYNCLNSFDTSIQFTLSWSPTTSQINNIDFTRLISSHLLEESFTENLHSIANKNQVLPLTFAFVSSIQKLSADSITLSPTLYPASSIEKRSQSSQIEIVVACTVGGLCLVWIIIAFFIYYYTINPKKSRQTFPQDELPSVTKVEISEDSTSNYFQKTFHIGGEEAKAVALNLLASGKSYEESKDAVAIGSQLEYSDEIRTAQSVASSYELTYTDIENGVHTNLSTDLDNEVRALRAQLEDLDNKIRRNSLIV
jgi:hypothetical protein